MRRAISRHPAGTWASTQARATVTLAFDDRHRRRIVLRDDAGEPFLLDLPEATVMGDGDGLALDGGGLILVRAAEEDVADFGGRDAAETARLAWHIGNRHIPVQVMADGGLRIRDDRVIVAMLEGLGARVARKRAPFAPERGAYAGASHGGHGAHDSAHGHGHETLTSILELRRVR